MNLAEYRKSENALYDHTVKFLTGMFAPREIGASRSPGIGGCWRPRPPFGPGSFDPGRATPAPGWCLKRAIPGYGTAGQRVGRLAFTSS